MSLEDDVETVVGEHVVPLPNLSYGPGMVVGGDYLLLRAIGQGGMGEVFAAESKFIANRICALKILAPQMVSPRTWQRFEREARSLAKLDHPGIVRIYTMGVDRESCPYYVMEMLEGESLQDYLGRHRRLDVEPALEIFMQVARALECAHRHDIVHRDLKPSNIMILKGGAATERQVKLVDFGVAALMHGFETQKITELGEAVGTPLYMSPEQFLGQPVSTTADVYSFGCSLFETLTGRPPFKGANALETIHMHQYKPAPLLREAYEAGNFSLDLEHMVARMLSKLPANRYQNMAQVIHDMERLQTGKTIVDAKRILTAVKNSDNDVPAISNQFSVKWWQVAVGLLACGLTASFWLPWALKKTPAIHSSSPDHFAPVLPPGLTLSAPKINSGKADESTEQDLPSQVDPEIERIIATSPAFNGAVDKDGTQHFHFPRSTVVGEFFWGDKKRPASGDFKIPRGIKPGLYISPDYSCGAIAKMRPDSVFLEVDITSRESLQKLLTLTRDWHQIRGVCFSDYQFEQSDAALLADLPKVEKLGFFSCHFGKVNFDNCKAVRNCSNLKLDVLPETASGNCPSGLMSLLKNLDDKARVKRVEMHRLRWNAALNDVVCRAGSIDTVYFERCIVSPEDFNTLCHKNGISNLTIADWPFTFAQASIALKTKPTVKSLTLTDARVDKRLAIKLISRGIISASQVEPWTDEQIAAFKRVFPVFVMVPRSNIHLGAVHFRSLSKGFYE